MLLSTLLSLAPRLVLRVLFGASPKSALALRLRLRVALCAGLFGWRTFGLEMDAGWFWAEADRADLLPVILGVV